MKKIYFIALIILIPAFAMAQNVSSNGNVNGNNSGSSTNTNNSTQSQTQSEVQNQNQNNNPGYGTQTQSQTQSRTQSPTSSAVHSPIQLRQNSSLQNRSDVANAVQALIQSSYQIENKGLGDQIRNIAQTQTTNNQSIDSSIDKASTRSSFAKFFIGPNYKELKAVKQMMDQNRLQIQNLEQLLAQIDNAEEAQNLQNQIEILNQQQTALQNDINDLAKGFSLFGWLNRLISRY